MALTIITPQGVTPEPISADRYQEYSVVKTSACVRAERRGDNTQANEDQLARMVRSMLASARS